MLLKQGRSSLVQMLFQSILFAVEGFCLTVALGTHVARTKYSLAAVGAFLSRLILKSLTIISLACGKKFEEGFVHRLALEELARPHQILLESDVSTPPALAVVGPSLSSATPPTQTSHIHGEGAVLLNPLDMESHGYNTDENARGGSGPPALEPLQSPSIGYRILTKTIAASALRDPPPLGCASGTQQEILNEIRAWISSDVSTSILWLSGHAGAGKSLIARTIMQECQYNKDARLASSFSFCRGTSDRNSDEHFVATISYQLAVNIPETRPIIEKIIEDDPSIFSRALNVQFAKLVIDPLLQVSKESDPRTLIIVDGLDECDGYDKQCGILDAIHEATCRHILPLRFLVASRPDPHIRDFFSHDNLREISANVAINHNDWCAVIREVGYSAEVDNMRLNPTQDETTMPDALELLGRMRETFSTHIDDNGMFSGVIVEIIYLDILLHRNGLPLPESCS